MAPVLKLVDEGVGAEALACGVEIGVEFEVDAEDDDEDNVEIEVAIELELALLLVLERLATVFPMSFKKTPWPTSQHTGSLSQQYLPFAQRVTRGKNPPSVSLSSTYH